jgi:aspartate/tyrosine/aromatic aminotransferase
MPQRVYPDQAPDEGSFTLTGNGSSNDIMTVTSGNVKQAVQWVVENYTATTVYVDSGTGTAHAASQGNEQVAGGGGVWVSNPGEYATWLAVYGAAGTAVNGTASGGLVIYSEI